MPVSIVICMRRSIFKYSFLLLCTILLYLKGIAGNSDALGIPVSDTSRCDINILAQKFLDTSHYDSALFWFLKGADSYRDKKDWVSCCRSYSGIAKSYRKLGKMDPAVLYLGRADSLQNGMHLTDRLLIADIEYIRSLIQHDMGDYKVSLKTANDFISKWGNDIKRETAKDTVMAAFFTVIGMDYTSLGDDDKMLEYYLKAVRYQESDKIVPDQYLATYYNNVAFAYMVKGNYRQAILYNSKASDIYESDTSIQSVNRANVYHTLGTLYRYLSNYDSALIAYKNAIAVYKSALGPDYFKIADLYFSIGEVYYLKGDNQESIKYHKEAARISEVNHFPDKSNLAMIQYMIGLDYYTNRQFEEAQKAYEKCIPLVKRYYPDRLPDVYSNLANCYTMLNSYRQAERFYKLAIQDRILIKGKNHPMLAHDLLTYGYLLAHYIDSAKGRVYLHKALDINLCAYGLHNKSTIRDLNYIGDYYLRAASYNQALDYLQRALIAESKDFNSDDIFSNPPIDDSPYGADLLWTLTMKAKTLNRLHLDYPDSTRLEEAALETSQLGVDLIQILRVSYTDADSKMAITQNFRDVLLNGITAAIRLYRLNGDSSVLNQAFTLAELSHAAMLNESMREAEARITGRVPASLIQKEKENDMAIYSAEQLILKVSQQTHPDSATITYWNGRLFGLRRDKSDFIQSLEKNYSSYYEMKYSHHVMTTGNLLRCIDKNEALVEYVLGDTTLYIFAFNGDGLTAVKEIAASQRFNNDLDLVIASLYTDSTGHLTPGDFSNYSAALYRLYNDLISPIAGVVQGKDIIIIPDGRLAYLPFEMLVMTLPDTATGYSGLNCLMNNHAVGYGYSATLLFDNKVHHKGLPLRSLVAFAPEYSHYRSGSKVIAHGDEPKNLFYIRDEVSYVSKLYGGKTVTGDDAVKSRFLTCAGDYRILHLAMHGLIDEDNPMFSKLVFSPSPDTSHDNYLNTYEIYNMSLNADMAVLSACNTGTGKYVRGEGIMSMARGFYYAGCPAIMATRWSVYDKSTEEIIRKFYFYLAQGFSKIEALRRARLDFLRTADPFRSHPRFWAAFACIGDPSPVPSADHRPAGIAMIIATFFILLTGIIFGIKRKK
jgi:CHAT domain-containing protein